MTSPVAEHAFGEERRERIVAVVNARGRVRIGELAREVAASEPTVRKDLALLERAGLLRRTATEAGHDVPAPASPVPALLGITQEVDVWRQAAQLRGLREARDTELREIARAAALRGVALRRQRAAALANAKAPAA